MTAASEALEAREKLFAVPTRITRWYSEATYDASEDDVASWLMQSEPLRAEYEATLTTASPEHQAYRSLVHILWRTYRRVETKPMLERLIDLDPADADSHFWLGQLHQEALGDPFALIHYEAFLALRNAAEPEPPNDYFLDGWFLQNHTFEPSELEALTNIGLVHRDVLHDMDRAREYFERAIAFAPNHHLAPYVMLADMLVATEASATRKAHDLYRKAIDVYLDTKWQTMPYDQPNDSYPSLEAWAAKRYPFAYRWWSSGIAAHGQKLVALAKMESTTLEVATACIDSLTHIFHKVGNARSFRGVSLIAALEAYSSALDLFVDRFIPKDGTPNKETWRPVLSAYKEIRRLVVTGEAKQVRLYARQVEVVYRSLRDYWQVEALCDEILQSDPDNATATKYRALAREKLHR